MAHSHPQQAETITPAEVHISGGTPPFADATATAAASAYNPKDASYEHVFQNKATSDRFKSDDQLNSVLNNFSSPYEPQKVATPDHAKGIKDVHRSLNAVNDASSSLNDAMHSARNGDIRGALQALHNTSGDLNNGGALLDRAQTNVGDLVRGDKDAQKSLGEAHYRGDRADSHIQNAEEKLRKNDIEGALKEMGTTSKEITEEQKALHHNIAQLNHDDKTYDHPQGLKDIRAAITSGDTVTDSLNDAIRHARNGDVTNALASLHQSADSLNSGGARLDAGAQNVGDLMSTDKSARKHISRGFEAENDASDHIAKAERLLRRGHIEDAITSMNRGITNVADEQSSLRTGLRRLKNDYAPGLGDQPSHWYVPLSNGINSADRNDNALKSGENPSKGNTVWDPYESLTLPMGPYAPER
ncbi:MAG: hypothetical protein JST89_01890 [Cyanobacteria bacterium SZAS-4]|nr:hypothetical protein [Cyanobacteria bacterium SZAS-4]